MGTNRQTEVRITESLAGSQQRKVDAEAGVIRGVKLLGLESRNGRVYPPHVVKAAVPLYEGVRVNVDHPVSGNPSAPRQYRDRIGVTRNARFVEGSGIYADCQYNPKHAGRGTLNCQRKKGVLSNPRAEL